MNHVLYKIKNLRDRMLDRSMTYRRVTMEMFEPRRECIRAFELNVLRQLLQFWGPN